MVPPADEERGIRASLLPTFPDQQTAVGGVLITGNASLEELSNGTEAILDVMDGVELDGFDVIVTGSPVFLGEINDYLQGGMLTLGAAALVVMALVLLLMFRVRWRLLPLASVLIGVVWAFALLGLIGIDLSLVTISGLPILIGLGIDFAIQIQNRVEEEVVLDRDPHPMAETLANLSPALIVATIAGVVAFLALLISQVPMIRDFGVMLAIGIVTLVVVGIVFTTAIVGIREWKVRSTERKPSVVERIVVRLGSLPAAAAVPLLLASVILFVAGVFLEGGLKIESDPIRWVDQDSESVRDIERLEERTGFSSTLGILIESNNVLTDEMSELINDFTLDVEERDAIVTASSAVNTIAKVIAIPGATPLAPTADDLSATADAMPPDVEKALLNPERTATQINLRLAPASLDERAELVDELQADLDERIAALEADLDEDSVLLTDLDAGTPPVRAVPSGLAVVGVGLLDNLSANRAILTYLGLALVGLWLLLRFRSLARALLTMVPIGLAVGATSVIVGVSGLTLSPLTTVSGPLVIATCTEFSVLIMARYLEERQRGLAPRAGIGPSGVADRTRVLHLGRHDHRRLRRPDRLGAAAAAGLRHHRHDQRRGRPARSAGGHAARARLGRRQGLPRHGRPRTRTRGGARREAVGSTSHRLGRGPRGRRRCDGGAVPRRRPGVGQRCTDQLHLGAAAHHDGAGRTRRVMLGGARSLGGAQSPGQPQAAATSP